MPPARTFPGQKTPKEQATIDTRMASETDRIIAEIRTHKAKTGRSATQATAHKGYANRFNNSNFGMGF